MRHFKASLSAIYTLIRLSIMKLMKFRYIHFKLVNSISPFVIIEIEKKARLKIGKLIRIRSGCKILARNNAEINIGDKTFINHSCILTSHSLIKVGNNVNIGPNVMIFDHDHDYKNPNSNDFVSESVHIGENTWIGAGAIILKGVHIGRNCVVAAGTVITKGYYSDNQVIYQKKEICTKSIERGADQV